MISDDDLEYDENGAVNFRDRPLVGEARLVGPIPRGRLVGASTCSLYELSVPFHGHDRVIVAGLVKREMTIVYSATPDGKLGTLLPRGGIHGAHDHVRTLENMGYCVVL